MRPDERRDSGESDLFRARLDEIVDVGPALARLGRVIDWRFLEGRFGAIYTDRLGHPPLPTRLMAGLSRSCPRWWCKLGGASRSRSALPIAL
jgi:IS5 family transposase